VQEKPDVDLVLETRRIRVAYDKAYTFRGITFHRRVGRTFVLRALPTSRVLLIQATIDKLEEMRGGISHEAACAVIVGSVARELPRAAQVAIWDAYVALNLQPTAADAVSQVSIGKVLRLLQTDPFNLTEDQVLALTLPQIQQRLKERGEEDLARMKAAAAATQATLAAAVN